MTDKSHPPLPPAAVVDPERFGATYSEKQMLGYYDQGREDALNEAAAMMDRTSRSSAALLIRELIDEPAAPAPTAVTDDMVQRFLSWRLPKDFAPDCGITYTPSPHVGMEPTGTNLLNDPQARAMLEHVIGAPAPAPAAQEPVAFVRMSKLGQIHMVGPDGGEFDISSHVDAALYVAPVVAQPVNMIMFCPRCGTQHIDAPDGAWTNPPHRSHLCHGCGHIWRPADVPTNGVAAIKTHGRNDTAPVAAQAQRYSASDVLRANTKGYALGLSQRTSQDHLDAERYRWLRAEADRDYVEFDDHMFESAEDLDAAIDGAKAKEAS